jgi:hypothetical protein
MLNYFLENFLQNSQLSTAGIYFGCFWIARAKVKEITAIN